MSMLKHNRSDWRLFLSLIILFAGASMPYVNPITPRLNSDLRAFGGLGLFGLVSNFCLPVEKTRFSLNPLSLLLSSWLLMAVLQWETGLSDAYISFFLISISYLVAVVLLAAWVQLWIEAGRGTELAQAFMGAVVAAGLVCATSILLQMLQLQDPLSPWLNASPHYPRQSGFMGQPNLCASLMTSAMACLVFVGSRDDKAAAPSAWRLAAMLLLMVGMHGAGSRSGYVEIIALSVLFLFMRHRAQISWVWCGLAAGQFILSSLMDALPQIMLLLPDTLQFKGQALALNSKAVAEGAAHSANSRLDLLKEAWVLIQAHPWFGVGWRRYQLAGVMSPDMNDPADHSHNLFVQIQAELGVLGSLSLWVFVGYWLLKNRPWEKAQGHQIAMLGVAMSLGIHSQLEYPLWHAMHLFMLGLALSLLPAHTFKLRCPAWVGPSAAALVLLLSSWVALDHRTSLAAYERYNLRNDNAQLTRDFDGVVWFRLVYESVLTYEAPVTPETHDFIKRVALENANTYDQNQFVNFPLLKIMILEGQTELANKMAARMCRSFGQQTMGIIQLNLSMTREAPYLAWLAQLPRTTRVCQPPA
jgi:O-antigen ligase